MNINELDDLQQKHFNQRLELIKLSAEKTKNLTPQEMIVRGCQLISFARNASKNIRIVEE